MVLHSKRKCIAVMYFLMVTSVDPQMAMYPMFPAPSPVQIAVHMPVPVPIMMRAPEETTRTITTTTTTEKSIAVAFPVAVPVPMPIHPFAFSAFPAVACQAKNRPTNCPPCPPCLCMPSCTPAFFSYCSPCHQKCRCRSKEDTPVPIPPRPPPPPPAMGPPYGVAVPMPAMFAPPPVVIVPFPPPRPRWRPEFSSSGSSSDCTYTDSTEDTSSSSSYEQRRKRRKKHGHVKRRPIYRRQFSSVEISDNELVKPVLTYLSQDGNVKLKRKLTNDEAAELMNDKPYQKIRVMAEEDSENMPRLLITSKNERKSAGAAQYLNNNHRRRQVVLTPGTAQHMLGEGKKELVFRPPGGKKISNLSVTFQISE